MWPDFESRVKGFPKFLGGYLRDAVPRECAHLLRSNERGASSTS